MPVASLAVGRIPQGYCVRLQGRCTMAESPAAHAFISHALQSSPDCVYVDVSECHYLDSTFLGALLDLHRRFGRSQACRFFLIAPADVRQKLFGSMHLHTVFQFAEPMKKLDHWVELTPEANLPRADLARHVMECHRRLAELQGPNQAAFTMIADQLERELASNRADEAR